MFIMNSLNGNVPMRCSVWNSNLIIEIIIKIYLEALASYSGEHFKWKNVNFIKLSMSQLYYRITNDSVHLNVTRNFNAI